MSNGDKFAVCVMVVSIAFGIGMVSLAAYITYLA